MMASRILRLGLLCIAVPTTVLAQAEPPADNDSSSSCIICHSQLEDSMLAPLDGWKGDVHREVGMGCEGCHGGDPSVELADDIDAMSPAKGFKPTPDRLEVPRFCGTCHADATFMKQFNPQARVDQLAEYGSSVHGRRNAEGDPVPATCIDCHGVHGIRPADSPDSPVYPTNVPETCARCHGESSIMAAYGIPTGQFESYMASVHAAALFEREDMSAPVCNDCHGNHGAAPPGVESVANVCGQCHAREAKLFRASRKKDLFDAMEVAECSVCHSNHRILHPTPEMFLGASAARVSRGKITNREPLSAEIGEITSGERVEVTWDVVLKPYLDAGDARLAHRVVVTAEEMEPLELDATVAPGATVTRAEERRAASTALEASLAIEPLSGVPVRAGDAVRYRLELRPVDGQPVRLVGVRTHPGEGVDSVTGSVCLQCHEPGDVCDEATERMGVALSKLDHELREAERLAHRAKLAGMDVSDVEFELKSGGTTAAIEARALIHSFDPERLIARTEEGRSIAQAALAAGRAAMRELQLRRTWLAVSLILIALVLVGLYLKIRQVARDRQEEVRSGEA
jgi:hypothetical protein